MKSNRVSIAGTCPDCGKRRFVSKDDAKRSIRRMKGRIGRVRAYRCGDYWHIGHPPSALIRGDLAADEIRPRRRA